MPTLLVPFRSYGTYSFWSAFLSPQALDNETLVVRPCAASVFHVSSGHSASLTGLYPGWNQCVEN